MKGIIMVAFPTCRRMGGFPPFVHRTGQLTTATVIIVGFYFFQRDHLSCPSCSGLAIRRLQDEERAGRTPSRERLVLLVLDEEFLARRRLVCQIPSCQFINILNKRRKLTLISDEIADLFIFGLLDCSLVVLRTLFEELLLNEVDACIDTQYPQHRDSLVTPKSCSIDLTLVKIVLILLALFPTASSRVYLVTDSTQEAAAAAAARAALLNAFLLFILVASREAIEGAFELIHGGVSGLDRIEKE